MLNELRFALRSLRKNPGVTAVVVLILALGIGPTTLVSLAGKSLPRLQNVSVNLNVLAAAASAAMLTGLLSGLVPALQAVRGSSAMALRELGLRIALGADKRQVVALVVRRGALLTLAGTLLGAAGALAATRVLKSFLFEVTPTDPVTFIGVAAGLALVALLASYIPARRATRVDPMEALRCE